MSVLACSPMGRFGNQCLAWLFCKAVAEATGSELRIDAWLGERVFQLDGVRPDGRTLRRVNEHELREWALRPPQERDDVEFRGYAQMQACVDWYSKRDAQSWLKLRPGIETACANAVLTSHAKDAKVVIHQRRGDYHGYGYPTVASRAYLRALDQFGLKCTTPECVWLSEEEPISHVGHLPDDLSCLPDFYRMMTAPTLLRGNSSFSWLAALLGDGLVLAPIVDGLEGGKDHDCAFVAGNWPRFANFDFVTDLHVSP